MAATKRVRDLQWITDVALPHVGLQDLLDQLLVSTFTCSAPTRAIRPAPATVRASSSTPHVECRLSWAATTGRFRIATDSPEGWRRHRGQ